MWSNTWNSERFERQDYDYLAREGVQGARSASQEVKETSGEFQLFCDCETEDIL